MSYTPKQFIDIRGPQYSDDPRLNDLIVMATNMTGDEFGDCKGQAIALRVLHWLTKETMAGGDSSNSGTQNSGMISGEKEGDLSRSYSFIKTNSSSKYGDLSTTGFGQELIELMNSCLFLPRNRLGTDPIVITR